MNQAAQQIPSNPALDFANAILAETNGARDLINLLHEISQGNYDASTNDQITANKILTDRGLGKCPKQSPVTDPTPNTAPETDDNDVEAIRESHPTTPHEGPESPRLVTQLDDSLNQSLGPAPSAETPPTRHSRVRGNPESPDPFDPSYIQSSIQNYILEITDNGRTIRTALIGIAFAGPENPAVTPYHRNRAATLLLDRILGTNPALALSSVEACPEHEPALSSVEGDNEEFVPDPGWIETLHEIKRMEDEGIIDNVEYDPFNPKSRMTGTEEEIAPYADEIAAKYRAELDLQAERRAKWPEIEERRRKKLAELYPSHSEDEDGKPPDT